MQINISDQRILLLEAQLDINEAKNLAWEKYIEAFGTLDRVASFLSKPKKDDFEITYEEHRYIPFWHVRAKARYEYTRSAIYQIPITKEEVKEVTIHSTKFDVKDANIHLPVEELCVQNEAKEVLVEGISGKNNDDLRHYFTFTPTQIKDELEKQIPKGSFFVPPSVRVSALMRDTLSAMIKGISADTIIEEQVEVTNVDLYYHPIFAFEFFWKGKNKSGILEIDGLTKKASIGERKFDQYLGKVLDVNFLFDIGADAAGMFVPGGSIMVKAAKKYLDTKKH